MSAALRPRQRSPTRDEDSEHDLFSSSSDSDDEPRDHDDAEEHSSSDEDRRLDALDQRVAAAESEEDEEAFEEHEHNGAVDAGGPEDEAAALAVFADLNEEDLAALEHLLVPGEHAPLDALVQFADLFRQPDAPPMADMLADARHDLGEALRHGDDHGIQAHRRMLRALEEDARHIALTLRRALQEAQEARRARRHPAAAGEHDEGEQPRGYGPGGREVPATTDRLQAYLEAVTVEEREIQRSQNPGFKCGPTCSSGVDSAWLTEVIAVKFRHFQPSKHGITADEVTRDRDHQNINWRRLNHVRTEFRASRTEAYRRMIPTPSELLDQITPVVAPTSPQFTFHMSTQAMLPFAYHHQLRHLLHAPTSSHEVFGVCAEGLVCHVDLRTGLDMSINDTETEARITLDAAEAELERLSYDRAFYADTTPPGLLIPRPQPRSTVLYDFSGLAHDHVLTSFGVRPPLLFMGEMRGGLVVRNYATGREVARVCVSPAANSIVNAITFAHAPLEETLTGDGLLPQTGTGTSRVLVCCNDNFARVYDLATLAPLHEYTKSVAVNYAAASPDGKQIALVGDAHEVWLHDASGSSASAFPTQTLKGHASDLFSVAYHPTEPLLATGGQDNTCRVYDLRRPDRSLYCFQASMAPVRSVQFSRQGDALLLAEEADYVHIIDLTHFDEGSPSLTKKPLYESSMPPQPIVETIDVMGELSGACFSPDGDSFFLGVADRGVHGCLTEFRRRHARTADDFFDD